MNKITILPMLLFIFNVYVEGQQADRPPNIIIFIADDISYEDLGCTGNPAVKTPHIDALAKGGLNFTNFYLTASSCSPSRNSIITGRYPHNTGAAELHTEPPLTMKSFPEDLQTKGYYTMQAGKLHMGSFVDRAFDTLIVDRQLNGLGGEQQWVSLIQQAPKKQPYFAWFAAYDAHRDWGENPFSGTHRPAEIQVPDYFHDTPATRKDLCDYYDEIARFDHHIGEVVKVLKERKEFENTLIIVMSDNGRPFPHSKTRVNDRGMKSPLIVYWPKTIDTKNKRREQLVSAVDLAPTLLKVAGIEPTANYQGLDFSKMLSNPDYTIRDYVFAEHNWHDYEAHERMVRNKEYLYILNSRPQLQQSGPLDAVNSATYFDLVQLNTANRLNAKQVDIFTVPRPFEELYHYPSDPQQWNNCAISASHREGLNELRGILKEWMQTTGDNIPEQLTKDWYSKVHNDPRNEIKAGARGEMPGFATKAIQINHKGPYKKGN